MPSQIDRMVGLVGSLGYKAPVRAVVTSNFAHYGLSTEDGVALASGDRVLDKDNPEATLRGIWDVSSTAWSRSPDFDSRRDVVQGTRVHVVLGTTLGRTDWEVLTAAPIVGEAMSFVSAGASDAATISYNHGLPNSIDTSVLLKLRSIAVDVVADYGADDTGATSARSAIQLAIDDLYATYGGGVVMLPPGTFALNGAVVLKSGIFLIGSGSATTRLRLLDGANSNVLETASFASLTLQNKWLISEGVPYGFGFDALTLDGNRVNQVTGNGVAIYGKGYYVGEDVKIVETKGVGFYSECAFKGGQVVEQDMPEGKIGKLMIYKTGLEGFVYRGPHDQPIGDVFVSQAGQDGTYDGIAFEAQTNVYQGATYVTGHLHAYACTGRGISLRASLPAANILTGENNWQDGVVFEAAGETAGMPGSLFSMVNIVEAYGNDNDDTGTYWGVRVSGSSNNIGQLRCSSAGQAAGGVYVSGRFNGINGAKIVGANATADGVGLKVDGNYHQIKATIENFDSGAAVGFESAGTGFGVYEITMFGCSVTGWLNSGASTQDLFRVTGFAASGTPFTQTGSFTQTNIFDVTLNYTATLRFSDYGGTTSAITVGNTSVTVTHLGFITPDASDIHITKTNDWGANRMWVANITATTFDVVTDAVSAGVLTFGWKLHI